MLGSIMSRLWPVLAIVLIGCGGSGSDPVAIDSPDTSTVEISGKLSPLGVAGASVEVMSFSGSSLGSTLTDDTGVFAIEINESEFNAGYRLRTVGGQISGVPINGELTAIYFASDGTENLNLTPATTLVSTILGGRNELTSISARNEVLRSLDDIGLFRETDWNQAIALFI